MKSGSIPELPMVGAYQAMKSLSGRAVSCRKRNTFLSPVVAFSRTSVSSGCIRAIGYQFKRLQNALFFMDYNDRPSNVAVDVNGRLLPRRWYRPPSHRPLHKGNGPTGIFEAPGLFPDRTKERQPLFVPLDPIHQESPVPDHPPVDYTRRRHHRVPDRPMTGNGSS